MVVGSRRSSNDCIFHLCTFFQGKTEGVRDLKSDTSAYLLERVFSSQRGIKRRMFFLSFFCYSSPLRSTLLIKDHAYSPRRILQHYNSSPQVQLSGAPHFFSSLSLSSPFHFSPFPPSPLLVCLPIRRPSFHVLHIPYPLRSSLLPSLHLYITTFTLAAHNALLPSFPSFPPSFSLTFHLHMQVLILKSWPTTDIQY